MIPEKIELQIFMWNLDIFMLVPQSVEKQKNKVEQGKQSSTSSCGSQIANLLTLGPVMQIFGVSSTMWKTPGY